MDTKNSEGNKSKIGLEASITDLLKEEKGRISGRLFESLQMMYLDKHYCGRKIKTVGDLVHLTETEAYRTPNFGEVTMKELNSLLTKYQLPSINIDMKTKHYGRKRRGLYL